MTWSKDLTFEADANVCTKLSMVGWGERNPSYTVGTHSGRKNNHAKDLDELKAHLRYMVKQWDKRWEGYQGSMLQQNKSVHRMAFIETVTSDLQPMARKYLRKLGFKRCGLFSKLKHPDTKITVWIMGAPEFLEAIKE